MPPVSSSMCTKKRPWCIAWLDWSKPPHIPFSQARAQSLKQQMMWLALEDSILNCWCKIFFCIEFGSQLCDHHPCLIHRSFAVSGRSLWWRHVLTCCCANKEKPTAQNGIWALSTKSMTDDAAHSIQNLHCWILSEHSIECVTRNGNYLEVFFGDSSLAPPCSSAFHNIQTRMIFKKWNFLGWTSCSRNTVGSF